MSLELSLIEPGKKCYFASDFHLGAPTKHESLLRERKIVRWLDHISKDAQSIFLVGDLFDFWFEYKHVVPKGYIRFLGKLTELSDQGIDLVVFVGNHDLWIGDYLKDLCGVHIFRSGESMQIGSKKFFIAHGDGLDPSDKKYSLIKKVFTNPLCQLMFKWLHPDVGISLANFWSHSSKESQLGVTDDTHLKEFCKMMEENQHHDYYMFGDCHIRRMHQLNETSVYCNLGDWIDHFSYAQFDGDKLKLLSFES